MMGADDAERPVVEPLSVRELIAKLELMIERHPEIANWRVHILDMDDGENQDEAWSSLVTVVETDRFSEAQPMVVSLLAQRRPFVGKRLSDADPLPL